MVASIICGQQTLQPSDVTARLQRRLAALDGAGVAEGSVIAVMLRNEAAFLEAALLARYAGCYSCLINWHLKSDEVSFILNDSGASVLIVHTDLFQQIREAIPPHVATVLVEPSAEVKAAFELDREEVRAPGGLTMWGSWLDHRPAAQMPERSPRPPLFYSSGTTGRPKGIRRQPATPEHVAMIREKNRIAYGIGPTTRAAAVAPLYHTAAFGHAMQSFLDGELLVVHPRFDAESLLRDVERHNLTELYLVPTLLLRLLRLSPDVRTRYDLGSLRAVTTAGAPCPAEVKRAMIDWLGPVVGEMYGSTESGIVTWCSADDALLKPRSVGRCVPGAVMRIVDDEKRALPPGTVGTIYSRNDAYPDFTYVNNDEARRKMEHDGLLTVGDMGYVDEDGYLFIVDRKIDMVLSAGVNIYPAEIEAVLSMMAEVADCAVFGIPDEEFGESLAAYVQLVEGAAISPDAIREFLRARIANFKVPGLIKFVDALPREETGKIFKRKLREPYWRDKARSI